MEEEKKVEEVKEEVTTEEVKEEPVGDSESITSEPVKEEVKEETVKKKSKLPIIILVVLLVAVLVGGIFIGKSLNSKDDKSDTKTEEKDKKKDKKEEDKKEDEETDLLSECKENKPNFKILKFNSSTNTYETDAEKLDDYYDALNEFLGYDYAAYSCINVDIRTKLNIGNKDYTLEYVFEVGDNTSHTYFNGEEFFNTDLTQPYPSISVNGNKLDITSYACDVADGCPSDASFTVDKDGKLVEVEEKKEDTESNFSKDNMKILEMYVTNSERYSVPSSVERVGYFDSNVKPEGLCYDNRKDVEPIGDCEEKYTFNINNKNVVIKMIRKDSVESFYVNDIKLNYNNKDGWVRTGSFYFVQIDSKVYVVAMVNMEYTYVIDLSENKIVNTVGAKSNMLFSKLDGKPILIISDVASYINFDFESSVKNAVYYYLGSNEKHKLTGELNENQYVDLLLTSSVW